jgi:prepilin-type processing-associated H-X9-DG protein
VSAFLQNDRQRLREYLLGTLPERERAEVESRLAESAEWRAALDVERGALTLLDASSDEAPPAGLSERVLIEVVREAESEPRIRRSRFNLALMMTSLGLVGIVAAIMLPALARSHEAARRASTQNNMKQIGLVLKMYANESHGELYPPMAPYPGVWMFDLRRVYPKYMTDIAILVDPGHPESGAILGEMRAIVDREPVDWERLTRLAARSFTYFGWVMNDEADAERLAQMHASADAPFDRDVVEGEEPIYRIREGVERFLITDMNNPAATAHGQSEIPLVIGNVRRTPDGTNVLYLDGHVDYVRMGSKFPVTQRMREILPIMREN